MINIYDLTGHTQKFVREMIKVRPVRAGDQADAFRIWKDGICGKIPVQPMTNILAKGD